MVAAEARGFILGAALARELGAGFVPARKPGKLPAETVSAEYALEYGIDALEVHADALAGGARVLIHDDLLATGGTARALCDLVAGLGAADRRLRVPGRAQLPRRPRAAGAAPRARPDRLRRTDRAGGAVAAAPDPVRLPAGALGADRRPAPHAALVAGGGADGGRRGGPLHAGVQDQAWPRRPARLPRARVRAAAEPRAWEQEIAGTPFERVLNESIIEVRLEPVGAAGPR